MKRNPREALRLARLIQQSAPTDFVPPSEGTKPKNEFLIPHAMVSGTRGYIEKVVFQINGSYENGWYDSCAVMMRRLVETLIIECFEKHGLSSSVQDPKSGDFYMLANLIAATLGEQPWNLGRNTRKALPKLKTLGDQSAHSRRYNAHREDIDKLSDDFRTICQELIYLAGLK